MYKYLILIPFALVTYYSYIYEFMNLISKDKSYKDISTYYTALFWLNFIAAFEMNFDEICNFPIKKINKTTQDIILGVYVVGFAINLAIGVAFSSVMNMMVFTSMIMVTVMWVYYTLRIDGKQLGYYLMISIIVYNTITAIISYKK